MSAH
jgi:hypothetical protein